MLDTIPHKPATIHAKAASIPVSDVPMGWSIEPAPFAGTIPAFDTEPRLVRGASAAPELVQLCGVWSRDLHPADASVEPKVDGHRIAFLGGDDRRLLSREGSAMGCAAHCIPALRELEQRFGEAMMFDGEFTVPGGLKETLRAFRRNKPAPGGVFWLFDALPLRLWQRGGTDEPLAERKLRIARKFGNDPICASLGRLLDHQMDADQTETLAAAMWRQKFEGLVIKDRAAGYRRGRGPAFLKLKQGN
jgi:ATP-dependent DNA ligase